MVEIRKQSSESRDYKERFEFVLTTGNNIICQRYFKINNFNPMALRSYELVSVIRQCVSIIDKDLKEKTQDYLQIFAPKIFNSVEEMNNFISDPYNSEHLTNGEGLVVKNTKNTDYAYVNGVAKELGYKFDDGELSETLSSENKTTYKFAFKIDGREVCSQEWEGYYPKFVRDKIDLSNKRGKFDESDLDKLSFEQSILYKMVKDKTDLVYGIIRNICTVCSFQNSKDYTVNPSDILDKWNRDSELAVWRKL